MDRVTRGAGHGAAGALVAILTSLAGCSDQSSPTEPPTDQPEIVFVLSQVDEEGIYRVRRDGSDLVRISETPVDQLAVSPATGLMAYVARDDVDRELRTEVYVIGMDGEGPFRLTNDPGYDYDPSWSPDGMALAFESDRTGDSEIFRMNVDGSDVRNLTNRPDAYDLLPAWSPDGSKILFWRLGGDEPTGLYVMNADGTEQRFVRAGWGTADWSPDGTRIVAKGIPDENGNTGIVVMDSSGSNALSLIPQAYGDYSPKWSPTTNEIMFLREGGQIAFIRPDGQGLQTTDFIDGRMSNINWLP